MCFEQQAQYLGQILGPTLAAVVFCAGTHLGDPAGCALVSPLFALAAADPRAGPAPEGERAGWRFFVTNRVLVTLLISGMIFMFGGMAYNSFEGPMVTVASLVGGALASLLASTDLANFHVTLAGMSFGPLDTLLAAAGLLIAGGGAYARLTLYRAVKRLRATREAPQHEVEPQQG